MKTLPKVLLIIPFIFIACSSANAVKIETEMLSEAQPKKPVENIVVFENLHDIDNDYTEIANFKSILFEENDPEQKIIEAFKNKAKDIGSNALIITKNEASVQAHRDLNVGGITTGIERTIEATAILTN